MIVDQGMVWFWRSHSAVNCTVVVACSLTFWAKCLMRRKEEGGQKEALAQGLTNTHTYEMHSHNLRAQMPLWSFNLLVSWGGLITLSYICQITYRRRQLLLWTVAQIGRLLCCHQVPEVSCNFIPGFDCGLFHEVGLFFVCLFVQRVFFLLKSAVEVKINTAFLIHMKVNSQKLANLVNFSWKVSACT